MHNTIINYTMERIVRLNSIIDKLSKRIESAPPGKLRVVQRPNRTEYYHRRFPSEKTGKYINKNNSVLIAALAQKEYDTRALKRAEHELKLWKKIARLYPDETFELTAASIPEEITKLITPDFLSDKAFINKWLNQPVKFLAYNEENKRFIVGDNLRTRSKSEYILATDFIEYKIPFLYERGLFLPVTEKWIYPDFTILNPETREEIYWEHFGMLDEPEYANKAILKLNEYELNGIHLGHQLIATFETSSHPLDISLVESIMSDIISGKWPR